MVRLVCLLAVTAVAAASAASPTPAAKSFCAPGMPGAKVCAGYAKALDSLLNYYMYGRSASKVKRSRALARLKAYWINPARREVIREVAQWKPGDYRAGYHVTIRQIAFASDKAARLGTQETWDVRPVRGSYYPLTEIRVTRGVVLLRNAAGRWQVTSYE